MKTRAKTLLMNETPQRARSILTRLYYLLARRPRTRYEILTWLNKREVPSDIQEVVFKKLTDLRLIDDLEFAKMFVRNRRQLKPRSIRMLTMELQKKGVAKDIIIQALQDGEFNEVESGLGVAKKRLRALNRYQEEERPVRLRQYLLSQGFSMSTVREVLDQMKDQLNPETHLE